MQTRAAPRVGAFFDVDKTILSENSGTLFLRALYDRGEVDWQTLLTNLGSYLQYKLNLLDIERWTKQTMRQFAGRVVRELEEEAAIWFEGYVLPTIYPEAVVDMRAHQEAGHVVALVSGATRFVVSPLADYLGVSHIMHTHLEEQDGRFTGRVIDPICFGEGKVYWLQQFIEQEQIDLARSHFYTDSVTDLPLLELVGHPHVVNPDPLLYRTASRRRWPIRFYHDPTTSQAKDKPPASASARSEP